MLPQSSVSHGVPVGVHPCIERRSRWPPCGARLHRSRYRQRLHRPFPHLRVADPRLYAMIVACCATMCAGLAVTLLWRFRRRRSHPTISVPVPSPRARYVRRRWRHGRLGLRCRRGARCRARDRFDGRAGWYQSGGPSGAAMTLDRPASARGGGTLTVHLPDPRGDQCDDCPSGFYGALQLRRRSARARTCRESRVRCGSGCEPLQVRGCRGRTGPHVLLRGPRGAVSINTIPPVSGSPPVRPKIKGTGVHVQGAAWDRWPG